MRDLLPELLAWKTDGKKAALATVIKTWGSSPRPVGAHMAVCENGNFCGSVSGGCVETAVISEALEIIANQQAKRLHFGVSDQSAWEVGLACGGEIEVFVTPLDWKAISPIIEKIQSNRPAGYTISLDTDGRLASIQDPADFPSKAFLNENESSFSDVIQPAPRLVVVGGVNLAQPLIKLAATAGYETVLVDPRRAFATPERFPEADRILAAWPEEAFLELGVNASTAVAVLSHDDKIDLPALQQALNSPAFFIGALGSQSTQQRRREALQITGFNTQQLERIKGPIGLDLGGNTPEEIAVSILAEIIAASHGK